MEAALREFDRRVKVAEEAKEAEWQAKYKQLTQLYENTVQLYDE